MSHSFYLDMADRLKGKAFVTGATCLRPVDFKSTEVLQQAEITSTKVDLTSLKIEPINADNVERNEKGYPVRATPSYTKTYTTFSGSDIMVEVNGKVVGEVEDLSYFRVGDAMAYRLASQENGYADRGMLVDKPVVVVVDYGIFGCTKDDVDFSGEVNFTINYLNEYGESFKEEIAGAVLVFEEQAASIDMISLEKRAIFAAKSVVTL